VKRFLADVFRTSELQETAKRSLVAAQITSQLHVTCNLKRSHLIMLWLKDQVGDPDLFRESEGRASRAASGPRAVDWRSLFYIKAAGAEANS
jgi:hypothetical protein